MDQLSPRNFLQCEPSKTDNTDGNNVPYVARPKGAALRRAQPDLSHSYRAYRSWRTPICRWRPSSSRPLLPRSSWLPQPEPGAQYLQSRSPQKTTKRLLKITSVLTKASVETHGRLLWLLDVSSAICRPPSWGNVIGNEQPGAPGSSSEWSRGESRWSWEEEGGSGRGRVGSLLSESP